MFNIFLLLRTPLVSTHFLYYEQGAMPMAWAVCRRPLTAMAWLHSQASLCEICGGQSDTGIGTFSKYFGFRTVAAYSFIYLSLTPYSLATGSIIEH